MSSSGGGTRPPDALYSSKHMYLQWINQLLQLSLTRVEQLASGAVYCQLLDAYYSDLVPLYKVNFFAREEYEILPNWKLLQGALALLEVTKDIDVPRLSKGLTGDHLELLQWWTRFLSKKAPLADYDGLARRATSVRGGTSAVPVPACITGGFDVYGRGTDAAHPGSTWANTSSYMGLSNSFLSPSAGQSALGPNLYASTPSPLNFNQTSSSAKHVGSYGGGGMSTATDPTTPITPSSPPHRIGSAGASVKSFGSASGGNRSLGSTGPLRSIGSAGGKSTSHGKMDLSHVQSRWRECLIDPNLAVQKPRKLAASPLDPAPLLEVPDSLFLGTSTSLGRGQSDALSPLAQQQVTAQAPVSAEATPMPVSNMNGAATFYSPDSSPESAVEPSKLYAEASTTTDDLEGEAAEVDVTPRTKENVHHYSDAMWQRNPLADNGPLVHSTVPDATPVCSSPLVATSAAESAAATATPESPSTPRSSATKSPSIISRNARSSSSGGRGYTAATASSSYRTSSSSIADTKKAAVAVSPATARSMARRISSEGQVVVGTNPSRRSSNDGALSGRRISSSGAAAAASPPSPASASLNVRSSTHPANVHGGKHMPRSSTAGSSGGGVATRTSIVASPAHGSPTTSQRAPSISGGSTGTAAGKEVAAATAGNSSVTAKRLPLGGGESRAAGMTSSSEVLVRKGVAAVGTSPPPATQVAPARPCPPIRVDVLSSPSHSLRQPQQPAAGTPTTPSISMTELALQLSDSSIGDGTATPQRYVGGTSSLAKGDAGSLPVTTQGSTGSANDLMTGTGRGASNGGTSCRNGPDGLSGGSTAGSIGADDGGARQQQRRPRGQSAGVPSTHFSSTAAGPSPDWLKQAAELTGAAPVARQPLIGPCTVSVSAALSSTASASRLLEEQAVPVMTSLLAAKAAPGIDGFTYRGKLRSLQDVCATLLRHAQLLLEDVVEHTKPRDDAASVAAHTRAMDLQQTLVSTSHSLTSLALRQSQSQTEWRGVPSAELEPMPDIQKRRPRSTSESDVDIAAMDAASSATNTSASMRTDGSSSGGRMCAPLRPCPRLTEEVRYLSSGTVLDAALKALGLAHFSLLQDIRKEVSKLTAPFLHDGNTAHDGGAGLGPGSAAAAAVATGHRKPRVFKLGEYQFKQLRNGDIYKGRYQGSKKNGEGLYEFVNADVYEGGFRDDRMDGVGVYTFSHEGRYEGMWCSAVYNGSGAETFAKGSTYHGEYAGGLRNGWGVCKFYNGDYYEGQWSQGLRHGLGMQQCTDDSNYVGQFARGKRHGYGVYSYSNGDRYVGLYHEDLPHGAGVYHFAGGQHYHGQWRQGKKDGWSINTVDNGSQLLGHWVDGKSTLLQPLKHITSSDVCARDTSNSIDRVRQLSGTMVSATDGTVYNDAAVAAAIAARNSAQQAADHAHQLALEHWRPDGDVQTSLASATAAALSAATGAQVARARARELAHRLDLAVVMLYEPQTS